LHKWFTNEEASATTRGTVEVISRSTEQRLGPVWWVQLQSSAEIVEGFIQVSVRQKRSGL